MVDMDNLLKIFGTQKAMAEALDLPASTVGAWAQRGIPPRRYPQIILAAGARGVDLRYEHLAGLEPFPQIDAGEAA